MIRQKTTPDPFLPPAGNSTRQLQPVGSRLENPFHLFDVLGNQAEWCQDWFAAYGSADGLVTDPTGPLNGQERVQRGGNFGDLPPRLRSAARQSRPRPHHETAACALFVK